MEANHTEQSLTNWERRLERWGKDLDEKEQQLTKFARELQLREQALKDAGTLKQMDPDTKQDDIHSDPTNPASLYHIFSQVNASQGKWQGVPAFVVKQEPADEERLPWYVFPWIIVGLCVITMMLCLARF